MMPGGVLPYMTHLMNDARETLQMRDKRIAELETALITETQRRERFQEDVDCTHMWLDDMGAPRIAEAGTLSLIGRMTALLSKG